MALTQVNLFDGNLNSGEEFIYIQQIEEHTEQKNILNSTFPLSPYVFGTDHLYFF